MTQAIQAIRRAAGLETSEQARATYETAVAARVAAENAPELNEKTLLAARDAEYLAGVRLRRAEQRDTEAAAKQHTADVERLRAAVAAESRDAWVASKRSHVDAIAKHHAGLRAALKAIGGDATDRRDRLFTLTAEARRLGVDIDLDASADHAQALTELARQRIVDDTKNTDDIALVSAVADLTALHAHRYL